MRHRARWRPALLTAVLLAPLVPALPSLADHLVVRSTALACPPDQVDASTFPDVAGSPFEREIGCLREYAVVTGRADGSYAPGAPVLRRQMALFLSRIVTAAGIDLPTQDAGFVDLADVDGSTHAAINAVAGLGISEGVDAARFAPAATVTRGQMATFLDRLHAAISGSRFPAGSDAFAGDGTDVHHDSINAIAAAGIGVGVTDRDFAPGDQVTRGQMAAFLARVLDVEVADGGVPSGYDSPDEPGPDPEPDREPPPPFTGKRLPDPSTVEHLSFAGWSARSSGPPATTC